jgi:hypothetical protein
VSQQTGVVVLVVTAPRGCRLKRINKDGTMQGTEKGSQDGGRMREGGVGSVVCITRVGCV